MDFNWPKEIIVNRNQDIPSDCDTFRIENKIHTCLSNIYGECIARSVIRGDSVAEEIAMVVTLNVMNFIKPEMLKLDCIKFGKLERDEVVRQILECCQTSGDWVSSEITRSDLRFVDGTRVSFHAPDTRPYVHVISDADMGDLDDGSPDYSPFLIPESYKFRKVSVLPNYLSIIKVWKASQDV